MKERLDTLVTLVKNNKLLAVAVAGVVLALYVSMSRGQLPALKGEQIAEQPRNPFAHAVCGSGFVEAHSRNLSLGSFSSGIVDMVHVTEGDRVLKGAPLFRLDTRVAEAQVKIDESIVQAHIYKQEAAQAAFTSAEEVKKRNDRLQKGVKSGLDVRQEELLYEKTRSQLKEAGALRRQAEAQLNQAQIHLAQLTVNAPIDGRVFKVYIKQGEYINNTQGKVALIMGDDRVLHVRTQIEESEYWRMMASPKAKAFVRGAPDATFDLEFVRIEPYAEGKTMLSGASAEFIDTRIVNVIFRIRETPATQMLIMGQELDVFVEAKPSTPPTAA